MMQTGVQLYTVREYCRDLNGFAETLKKISDIGYKTVQVCGTCDYDPAWLKEQLDANGLQCVLTQTSSRKMVGELDEVVEAHRILECTHTGPGKFPFNEEKEEESYDFFIQRYKPLAQKFHEKGMYFMYHNHAHEFKKYKGRVIMEWLAEDIPAEWMGFTLDTFWVQAAGGDPAQWLERLSGRVPIIHLKDLAYDRLTVPLGEGNLNFDRIFEKAEQAGTRYLLVEQDDCYGEDPLECLRRSYLYLKAHGFE